ncbi:iron-containing alcohol dehydrogenase [Aliarcobacter cryaerophilus]|uniref:iron-containing alcohol dehydrogenase n=1 Tax=Aliarcobacter cryaerophilus TaxID=28198 RepID=UPI0021B4DBCB|nr:iron-containing alcohol dehydrogenase [Aliarcobacter cryaerophilus]MCT7406229.1 iron-containing alcohol dehydrogenase [Aliarcobacter cryaerophilus]MCT7504030.1 iron-containing alcohol dehydrogenase [Aliarcobacter cryaerophilus]
MENFSFCNPTQIEFGRDKEKNIGKYISQNGVKKVLLVYGSKRVIEDGLFDVVIKSLKENGVDFIAFGGVVSNPILGTIQNAIKIAKDEQVDGILSLGGGSVLDSSKAIAVGTLYDVDVWDFFLGKEQIKKALPIFDIITLAATGSEMNGYAVVTNEKTKQKFSIWSPLVYPKVSVINPELQKSVSKEYLVYSATDVIAHTIEGYFTAKVQPKYMSRQVENIIKTVIETTEILIKNPDDYSARGEFAWGATNALNGTTTVGTSGFSFPNHLIEHSLSALYNVPHGAGLSVVIPAWAKWYYKQNEAQFIRFAKEIFEKSTALEGIEALESWFNKIGTPTRLNQFGLDKSNISDIIENLSYQNDIEKDDLEKILSNAL